MGEARKRHALRNFLYAFFIGLAASILVIIISDHHLFKSWELKTYDFRMSLNQKNRLKPENVALLYVDEASLRYMEDQGINWPWPRELYASAVDFCRRGGARAIVFDLFFSEDSVYGVEDDEAFASVISGKPPVYFVLFLSEGDGEVDDRQDIVIKKSAIPFEKARDIQLPVEKSLISLPIWPLVERAGGFGNAQIPPDEDGVYRRIDLVSMLGDTPVPSIALKVVSDIEKINGISFLRPREITLDNVSVPLDDDGRVMINYYGETDTFPSYPLAEVLAADSALNQGRVPRLDPGVLKNKVVIIGVAAPGLYDIKSTPLSRTTPGAEIHATVIENLLRGDFIKPISKEAIVIITIASALLAAAGLVWISSSWGVVLWLVFLVSLVIGFDFFLFSKSIWMRLIIPVGAIAITSFSMMLLKFFTEGRKKREIRKAFSQYLSPEVVSEIANDPEGLKLGGTEKEVTLFFSDIADFTTISEKTPPDVLVKELNDYFTMITAVIHKHGGTLDKYIGDAVMAFWGAPLEVDDHASRAVAAALEVQKVLKERSQFVTRIGIHTSSAIIGNIGSDIRFNYTAIGDAVNLASRLEGMNKNYGTNIVISESTYKQVSALVEARRIGRVRVKGRTQPISIFEPLGLKGDFTRLGLADYKIFEEALNLFEAKRFEEAGGIFGRLAAEKNDPVSKIYKDICMNYIKTPPDNFDGITTFKVK